MGLFRRTLCETGEAPGRTLIETQPTLAATDLQSTVGGAGTARAGGKWTLTAPVPGAQSGTMLTVHTTPAVTAEPLRGWHLTFWLGEAFDFGISFRAALAEIASILGEAKPTNIALPNFVDGEDFVEGQLSFGNATIGIYYEYSLGYLSLNSSDRAPLDQIETLTLPFVRTT